jgi:uncharacterized SAM-binding protein YcdF (DUF218 family)
MNIFIVLLGCHIFDILLDRVQTSIEFVNNHNKNNQNNITWILSGGIKNNIDINIYDTGYNKIISEAEQMKNIIMRESQKRNYTDIYNWNFILDTVATNTAENFIIVNNLLNSIKYNNNIKLQNNNTNIYLIDTVYVVTSKFHYDRAKKIADLVDNNNKYEWILSPYEERKSYYWESIHMKNVENDVYNAKKKFGKI